MTRRKAPSQRVAGRVPEHVVIVDDTLVIGDQVLVDLDHLLVIVDVPPRRPSIASSSPRAIRWSRGARREACVPISWSTVTLRLAPRAFRSSSMTTGSPPRSKRLVSVDQPSVELHQGVVELDQVLVEVDQRLANDDLGTARGDVTIANRRRGVVFSSRGPRPRRAPVRTR